MSSNTNWKPQVGDRVIEWKNSGERVPHIITKVSATRMTYWCVPEGETEGERRIHWHKVLEYISGNAEKGDKFSRFVPAEKSEAMEKFLGLAS